MTQDMRDRLIQAIELIKNCLEEDAKPAYKSIYLSVAAEYCRRVSDKLGKEV